MLKKKEEKCNISFNSNFQWIDIRPWNERASQIHGGVGFGNRKIQRF